MKLIKISFRLLFIIIAVFVIYVSICLIQGTLTDFAPQKIIDLEISNNDQEIVKDSVLTFFNWNIGYGGLGAQSNFFYDDDRFLTAGNKMIRSSKDLVTGYLEGITDVLSNNRSDFILLQEVDRNSKRSYYTDEHDMVFKYLNGYNHSFALNYKVSRVPIPILNPWKVMGKMESGLSVFSKNKVKKAQRYQYPGAYSWPDYIFHLDRCFIVQKYEIQWSDKELVVINTHNSAYDGGKLKSKEMQYLKEYVLGEFEKGNFVIVAGDWNQTAPGIDPAAVSIKLGIDTTGKQYPYSISEDFLPSDWKWAFDQDQPTNRSLRDVLDYGRTKVSLIDYYLLSPNVQLESVECLNLKFKYSDHNPVRMKVKLMP